MFLVELLEALGAGGGGGVGYEDLESVLLVGLFWMVCFHKVIYSNIIIK